MRLTKQVRNKLKELSALVKEPCSVVPASTIEVERKVSLARIKKGNHLRSRLKELEGALEFYAAPETYLAIFFVTDTPCGDFIDDFEATDLGLKPGKRARAALRGNGGKGETKP